MRITLSSTKNYVNNCLLRTYQEDTETVQF